MVFGSNEGAETKQIFGYKKSGENINFTPNSIVFKPTATRKITVSVGGRSHTIQKGEVIDDASLAKIKDKSKYEAKPWLEGKSTVGETTISIAFSPSVQARFATYVTTQSGVPAIKRQNVKVYNDMMRDIGIGAQGR